MIRRRSPGRRARHGDGAGDGGRDVPDIAGYRDLQVIGRGATATVYRATQEEFGRTVAIKLLHVDVSDRRAQRRFAREKAINGRLSNHPNVVTVYESGFVDGRSPYLVMEYFGHGSLAQRLAERGPFSVESALHVGVRIAGALASAHAAGVLHRDVKPQNVLLSQFGEPALADFGIATVLEMEQSLTAGLTPVHAAPELLEQGEPSPRSDVYALASTIYHLLAGTPPFAGPAGEGMLAQLLRITSMEMPAFARRDVPDSLVAALRSALAKRPEERPTGAEFGRLLQQVQTELGLPRTPLPVELPDELSETRPDTSLDADAPATPAPPDADAPVVGAGAIDSPTLLPAAAAPEAAAPETAVPASLPPIDHADADVTVGAVDDAPTVLGRQRHPAPAEPSRRRPRLIAVGVASLLVAAAAGLVALVAGGDDGDDPVAAPDTGAAGPAPAPASSGRAIAAGPVVDGSPGTDAGSAQPVDDPDGPAGGDEPDGPADPADPADVVPTNLHAWFDADGGVVLEWDAPASPPATLYLWVLFPGGERIGAIPVPGASRTYPVTEIPDPRAPLCLVFTAPSWRDTDSPVESETECINGAVRRDADGAVGTTPAAGSRGT